MRHLLILSVFLVGCGQQQQSGQATLLFHSVDPAIQTYYDEFSSTFGIDANFVPAGFAEIPSAAGDVVGECIEWTDGEREIHIDPVYWQHIDTDTRKQLIFHELGHCVLQREHTSTMLADSCDASIMNPYSFGDPCFTLHYAYYINELIANRGH